MCVFFFFRILLKLSVFIKKNNNNHEKNNSIFNRTKSFHKNKNKLNDFQFKIEKKSIINDEQKEGKKQILQKKIKNTCMNCKSSLEVLISSLIVATGNFEREAILMG